MMEEQKIGVIVAISRRSHSFTACKLKVCIESQLVYIAELLKVKSTSFEQPHGTVVRTRGGLSNMSSRAEDGRRYEKCSFLARSSGFQTTSTLRCNKTLFVALYSRTLLVPLIGDQGP